MISKAWAQTATSDSAADAVDSADTEARGMQTVSGLPDVVDARDGEGPPPPMGPPGPGLGEGQGVSIGTEIRRTPAQAARMARKAAADARRQATDAAKALRQAAKKARQGATAPDEAPEATPAPPPPATPTPAPPSAPATPPAIEQNTAPDAAGQVTTPAAGSTASVGTPATGPQSAAAASVQAAWDFIIDTYRHDPLGFVKEVLGVTPDPWQEQLLGAVGRGERRISIRSGHGVGKTAGCGFVVVHQLVTRYPQKTIMTAPTEGQLMNALFPEVRIWLKRLPPFIFELFELQSDRIFLRSDKDGSFVSAKTSSAERPEAMAGVHADEGWVLLVCDEASAIPEQVYEAAAGSMSGWNCCTILISNPTRNTGLFFDTHHRLKGDWFTLHVSCLTSKRVAPDFVKQIIATYGEDSNAYRIRVLGEFATSDDDVLIPAEWVDSAIKRDIALDAMADLTYGLDVARFGGDKCVLVKRKGNIVVDIIWWAYCDTMETVGKTVQHAKADSPNEICVDSIGLGAGVADRLRELGFNVRDVNVSESAAMNPQAAKLRDELWIACKDWLGSRAVKLPQHDELRQDLCAPTYGFTGNGKTKVEDKASIKKRLRRSPDYGDALCLTFAGQAAMVGGRASKWITGKPLKRQIRGVV
jgi:phage terminase large subunit